jgi:hypothetical protein
MDMILAEEFLLIALDDEKGTPKVGGKDVKPGLAGALLLDLAAAGAVRETDGKLEADPGARVEHPVLCAAYDEIAASEKRRDTKAWVTRLPRELKPIDDRIADGLVERGVLRREDGKILGLFNATKFPEADGSVEAGVREGLAAVLRSPRQPTPREAMLIALLRSYDQVPKLVPKEDRKAAKARAKEVADEGIAGKAVSDTLKATEAAVMAAVIASSAATTASGS